jgi:(2Fe-2S) ferredoxin
MSEMKAHLFICVNDRGPNGKESCAQKGSQKLKDEVKALCASKNLPKGSFRINNSGCLGPCEKGISVVMYPEGKWVFHAKPEDAENLANWVEKTVKE